MRGATGTQTRGRGSHVTTQAETGVMRPQAKDAGGTRSRQGREGPSPEPVDGARAPTPGCRFLASGRRSHWCAATRSHHLRTPMHLRGCLTQETHDSSRRNGRSESKGQTQGETAGVHEPPLLRRSRDLGFSGNRQKNSSPPRSPGVSPGVGPSTDPHAEPQTSAILGVRKKLAAGLSRDCVPPAPSESHCW